MSSRWVTNTVDLPERHADQLAELDALKREMRRLLAEQWTQDLSDLAGELVLAQQESAQPLPEPPAEPTAKPAEESPRRQRVAAWRKLLVPTEAEPPWEDPLRPWVALVKVGASAEFAEQWTALRDQYAAEGAARGERNRRDYELVADFSAGQVPEGWSVDGVGLRNPVAAGDFNVALSGDKLIERVWPGGRFTHLYSTLLNGAIRTPLLGRLPKSKLTLELVGGDFAAQRTIVDNAFLTERQSYLNQSVLGWLEVALPAGLRERRTYLEFATKTSNPNFPPRVGLGGACSEEQAADPRSWFGVSRVFAHDAAGPPADELERFAELFGAEGVANLPAVAAQYQRWFVAAVQAWSEGRATRDDVRVINWLLDQGLLTNRRGAVVPELVELQTRYCAAEQRLQVPATVNGMADLDQGLNYPLNVRGDYDQLGDPIPRGYLEIVCGGQPQIQSPRSGRLELADWIASIDNPLTARVFVNRVWYWLFGAGLVTTLDDFGHLGERPSHPELLDYLAGRFQAEGWSLKKLVREIVLTETWQQAGDVSADASQVDPRNRWLHHYPLRRLEAESLRDALLVVSGRWDARLGGPPLNPPRANEDAQKRLFSGPLDGLGRRSLYTKITIMEPPRFLATFNQPAPKLPTGRRDVSNTPAQSLTLLNDPLVAHLAEAWTARLLATSDRSVAMRITDMFRVALGREPTPQECERWSAAAFDLARLHGASESEVLSSAAVWQDLAHAMFNAKEFIYLR